MMVYISYQLLACYGQWILVATFYVMLIRETPVWIAFWQHLNKKPKPWNWTPSLNPSHLCGLVWELVELQAHTSRLLLVRVLYHLPLASLCQYAILRLADLKPQQRAWVVSTSKDKYASLKLVCQPKTKYWYCPDCRKLPEFKRKKSKKLSSWMYDHQCMYACIFVM